MKTLSTRALEGMDCLVCRTVLGFLTTPLLLVMGAGVAIAL